MRSFALALVASFVLLAAGTAGAQQACAGDPACDDGNLCTIDSCVANACVRTPDVAACGPAVDFPLGAKKVKLRIPPSNPLARGMRMLTTEGALSMSNLPVALLEDDPVLKGGSLRIFSATGGFDHTYPMPAEHWDYFPLYSAGSYEGYQYKDNHNEASAIGVVKIIADNTMKMKGKGQDESTEMQFDLDNSPDPVSMILSLGNNRYCFQFGATAQQPSERANWVFDKIFWAKNAFTPPTSCPCAIDSDCDDGQACTGTETCVAGFCQPGGLTCP